MEFEDLDMLEVVRASLRRIAQKNLHSLAKNKHDPASETRPENR
jgi:hypothetical protein